MILTHQELCRCGSATAARHLPGGDHLLIRNGGWHFSYLGGPERIARKLESFAHTDLDRDELKDLRRLRERVDNHQDIFDRPGHEYRTVELDERYPRWLLDNRERFRHLIRDPERPASSASDPSGGSTTARTTTCGEATPA